MYHPGWPVGVESTDSLGLKSLGLGSEINTLGPPLPGRRPRPEPLWGLFACSVHKTAPTRKKKRVEAGLPVIRGQRWGPSSWRAGSGDDTRSLPISSGTGGDSARQGTAGVSRNRRVGSRVELSGSRQQHYHTLLPALLTHNATLIERKILKINAVFL